MRVLFKNNGSIRNDRFISTRRKGKSSTFITFLGKDGNYIHIFYYNNHLFGLLSDRSFEPIRFIDTMECIYLADLDLPSVTIKDEINFIFMADSQKVEVIIAIGNSLTELSYELSNDEILSLHGYGDEDEDDAAYAEEEEEEEEKRLPAYSGNRFDMYPNISLRS